MVHGPDTLCVTSVVLLSEIALLREGLLHCLAADGRVRVLGDAPSIPEAERLCRAVSPDVLLLDAAMPDALPGVQLLRSALPGCGVVGIGLADEPEDMLAFVEAGMGAYVPRSASVAELVETVLCMRRGEVSCSPRLAATLFRRVASLAVTGKSVVTTALTRREHEIARLLADGRSNKEIAVRLGIELTTTKNHVHKILEKLGLRRRGQVGGWLRYAPPAGW